MRTQTPQQTVFWQQTEPVVPEPPLRGPADCDVCIVGSGYAGMWTAYFLKEAEPGLDIRLVEAEYAGYGASGRADGFVTPTIGKDIRVLVEQFGLERTRDASAAVGRSILEIGRFTRRNNIDAEYETNNYLMVATNTAQLRRLHGDRELATAITGAVQPEVLGPDEAREVIGSPAIVGAMRAGGAQVNPFKLARGLARVIKDMGVTVYEHSPVLDVAPGVRPTVVTEEGRITADKVVITANVHQSGFAPFRDTLVPVWSYAMVSEPLTDEQLGRIAWAGREGMVEAKTFLTCGRFTADNRVLWAGGPALYFYGRDTRAFRMSEQRVYRRLMEEFRRFFPMWHDVAFSYAYGGTVDITRDYAPHFGALPGGSVLYGYGFCGNGIAATHTGGKVLRDLVLGKDTDYSRLLYVDDTDRRVRRFPPEPLLYAGVRATSRWIEWRESRG